MYDVAIIGAGTMGMAAGCYLAKDGKKVALIDTNDPPHTEGAHHGATRLARIAHGEGGHYVPLALRAQILFNALEEKVDEKLFYNTGVLCIGPAGHPFLRSVLDSADHYNLAHEVLKATEVNERWPGYNLPAHLQVYYEHDSGVLMSERVIAAYRKLADDAGAEFYFKEKLTGIDDEGDAIFIDLGNHTIEAKKVIITAGKGTNEVLSHLKTELPLKSVRKTFSWFDSEKGLHQPEVFPGWSYVDEESMYYGFPSMESAGVKIGRHDGGTVIDADKPLAPFGSELEDGRDTTGFAADFLSGETGHRAGKVCTYTYTPDDEFIIDHLPGHKNIIMGCGFSGHGFKFSSAIGEILAQMADGEKPDLPVGKFSISRFS